MPPDEIPSWFPIIERRIVLSYVRRRRYCCRLARVGALHLPLTLPIFFFFFFFCFVPAAVGITGRRICL